MHRPRVKRSLDPMRISRNRVRIGTYQAGIAFDLDDHDGSVWTMLSLLDGSRDASAVAAAVCRRHPGLDPASVAESLEHLLDAGVCEDATSIPPALSEAELARFSRSAEYLSWIDTRRRPSRWETLLMLRRARVVVAGLGGAGSSVAMALAASGIGRLHVLDFDRVESSNLNRQLLYSEADVGRPKVEAAVERLRGMSRFTQVTGESLRIDSADALARCLRDHDLLVLCADTPKGVIVQWASAAALACRKPWIVAGYAGPMTVVGTYLPFVTGCAECELLTQREARASSADYDIAEHLLAGDPVNAVMAPTAAVAGNIAALEAVYLLTGLEPKTLGRTLNQNLMLHDQVHYVDNPRRADCPACGDAARASRNGG